MVWDGDGPVWRAEEPRIRLTSIVVRELESPCTDGHPCPTTDAIRARYALVELIDRPVGIGHYGHVQVTSVSLRCVPSGSADGRHVVRLTEIP